MVVAAPWPKLTRSGQEELIEAFIEGVVAGYGIALPVGAISVLIVEMGVRRGMAPATAAAFGAASADLLYAGLAAIAGVALAAALDPAEDAFRIIGAVALAAIAVTGVVRAIRSDGDRTVVGGGSTHATYLTFLGLTAVNPLTIVYFSALILGLSSEVLSGAPRKAAFVAGAFLASLSWQLVLAGIGALFHRRMRRSTRVLAAIAGNLIVLGLAVRLLIG